MIFFDILLFSLWISSLVIIIRLIAKSGKLHYNSNKILLLILSVFSFALVRHIFLHQVQDYYNIIVPIDLIFNSSIACLIPILAYLYVKKIINDDDNFNATDIKHFIVFTVFYILFEIPYMPDDFYIDNGQVEKMYWSFFFKSNALPIWLITLRSLLNIFYTISTYILLNNSFKTKSSAKQDKIVRRWLNKLTHVKSSSKQVQLVRRWVYNFTHVKTLMTITSGFFTLNYLKNNEVFPNNEQLVSTSIALIFFLLALFLNKNRTILFNLPHFMNPDSVKREKIKNEFDVKKIYDYVTTQIEEQELYLNNQFNLNWLATELEIKASYISIAINENNFENFSMYSNHFKIEKAKKLIKNNYLKNYSVEALASASGFKAVNTFYRIFKNETGITPNTYAENRQRDD
tara:strand:- start:195 stop:1403 length:1209 start_codon:yes stop_codon:yes gene_type:complete